MREIFEHSGSNSLRGSIVWTPMLVTDSEDAAMQRETSHSDSRIRQFWDPDRILGQLLSQTLNLRAPVAWDVYLAYRPGHAWESGVPPGPEFWMHQLDEEPTLLLHPLRLKNLVQEMIRNVD